MDDQTTAPIVTRNKLREITTSTVPSERLDFDTETVLIHFTDEFTDDLLENACRLARHRDSTTLEASDLLLYLQREHDITVDGYQNLEDKVPLRKGGIGTSMQAMGTEEHARRASQAQRASTAVSSQMQSFVPGSSVFSAPPSSFTTQQFFNQNSSNFPAGR